MHVSSTKVLFWTVRTYTGGEQVSAKPFVYRWLDSSFVSTQVVPDTSWPGRSGMPVSRIAELFLRLMSREGTSHPRITTIAYLLINAVTGQVGTGTKMSGYPTYQACGPGVKGLLPSCPSHDSPLGLHCSVYPAIRRRPVCFGSSQPANLCMTVGKAPVGARSRLC